jgi:hypothetical protein
MKYFPILVFFLMIGCKSQNFTIDDNSNVLIKKAFYQVTPAGIKEGNTYVNISVDVDLSLTSESIEILGVYFMGDYAGLQPTTTEKQYIGSLTQSEKKEKMKDFPFKLTTSEFVLKYKKGKKIKYGLFKIRQKNSGNNIPM